MKISFLACAQGAVLDQSSQNISLFNIIDALQAASFPLVIAQMSIATTLVRDEEESAIDLEGRIVTIRAILHDEVLVQGRFSARFQGKDKTRFMSEIPGIVVPSPGELKIALFDGETMLSFWPIEVTALDTGVLALENSAPAVSRPSPKTAKRRSQPRASAT